MKWLIRYGNVQRKISQCLPAWSDAIIGVCIMYGRSSNAGLPGDCR